VFVEFKALNVSDKTLSIPFSVSPRSALLVSQSNVVAFMISDNGTLMALELANATHDDTERFVQFDGIPIDMVDLSAYNKHLGTTTRYRSLRADILFRHF
jgi:hypothetical protein